MKTKDVQILREVIKSPEYFNRRFLHFKILALKCAQDFYLKDLYLQKMAAYNMYKRHNRKAQWYENKIRANKHPEAFEPFYLK